MLVRFDGITADAERSFLDLDVDKIAFVLSLYANALVIVKKIDVDFRFIDADLPQFPGQLSVKMIGQQSFKSSPVLFSDRLKVFAYFDLFCHQHHAASKPR